MNYGTTLSTGLSDATVTQEGNGLWMAGCDCGGLAVVVAAGSFWCSHWEALQHTLSEIVVLVLLAIPLVSLVRMYTMGEHSDGVFRGSVL